MSRIQSDLTVVGTLHADNIKNNSSGYVTVDTLRIQSGTVSLFNNGAYTKIQSDTSKNVILTYVSDDQNFSQIATRQYVDSRNRDFSNVSLLSTLVAIIIAPLTDKLFGNSVSIDGRYVLVGEYHDDSIALVETNVGSASMFEILDDGTTNRINYFRLPLGTSVTNDFFGNAVCLSGNYAVISATGRNTNTGAVYVYERNITGDWAFTTQLTASDSSTSDLFGTSVGVSGNYLIVGAEGKNTNKGQVYIFERNNSGVWFQKTALTASDGTTGDKFGHNVAIDGNYAVVSAYQKANGTAINQGSAYVYNRTSAGVWSFAQKITGSDSTTNDQFATDVDISGHFIVAGAPNSNASAGAVYVFSTTSTGGWSQQSKLTASDSTKLDNFGIEVAISGDHMVVGAGRIGTSGSTASGKAYLFSRATFATLSGGTTVPVTSYTWNQEKILSDTNGNYGNHVDMSGHNIVISQPTFGTNVGRAYIYQASLFENEIVTNDLIATGGTLTGISTLVATNASVTNLQTSSITPLTNGIIDVSKIRIESGTLSLYNNGTYTRLQTDTSKNVILAHVSDDQNFSQIATRQFMESQNRDFMNVQQLTTLLASDAVSNDLFGNSVAINGNFMVIGAPLTDTPNTNQGSAYIYEKLNDGTIIQIQKITASNATANDEFGASVAISGNYVIVGAPLHDVGAITDQGSAYIYERNSDRVSSSQWVQTAILTASDGTTSDKFGICVGISGNYAIVGSFQDDVNSITDRGSAYIFERNNAGSWLQKTQLTASDGTTSDQFGFNVDIDGNYAVIGAPFTNNGTKLDQGSAYVFNRSSAGVWSQQQKLTASDGTSSDRFGWSVHIDGNNILVGAPLKTVGSNASQGAVYLFSTTSTGAWTQQAKITSSDGSTNEHFGTSVAISGNGLVIGSTFSVVDITTTIPANISTASAGYTYMYNRTGATVWSLSKKISTTNSTNAFGWDVDIDGHTIISGALRDTVTAIGQGQVYVYEAPLSENAIVTNNLITSTITPLTNGIIDVSDVRIESGTMSLYNNGTYTRLQTDTSKNVILAHVSDDQNFSQIATRQYVDSRNRDFTNCALLSTLTSIMTVATANTKAFGNSISVDGRYVLVGENQDDTAPSTNSNIGSASMFEILDDGAVNRINYFRNPVSSATNGSFGADVCVSGNYAVIGTGTKEGIFVYERNIIGDWAFTTQLTASDGISGDGFGNSVSISGNYLITGAPSKTVGAKTTQGEAYIFERNNSAMWFQKTALTASDGTTGDSFGNSIAIDGNYAVIGASGKANGTATNQGYAYIYQRSSAGVWSFIQRITGTDSTTNDQFGTDVDISGHFIVAGAPNSNASAGAVYVFTTTLTGDWSQQAKLTASDATTKVNFGQKVAISGDHIVVGASRTAFGLAGEAYVFSRSTISTVSNGTTVPVTSYSWNQDQIFAGIGNNFGGSVDISGHNIAIGAFGFLVNGFAEGRAYIYQAPLSENAIVTNNLITSTITPLTNGIIDISDVRIESGTLSLYNNGTYTRLQTDTSKNVVLAHVSDDQNFSQIATRQYVDSRNRDFSNCTLLSTLSAINTVATGLNKSFGNSVSIDGRYVIVGESLDDSATLGNVGSASLFEIMDDGTVNRSNYFRLPTGTPTVSDLFGYSVCISGNYVAIGADQRFSNAAGAVYMYERNITGDWAFTTQLTASDSATNDNFGTSVGISGNYLLVGAEKKNTNKGQAYIFERNNSGMWIQKTILTASDGASNDFFGHNVAIDGNYAVVGAYQKDNGTATNQGYAYIYNRSSAGVWSFIQKITGTDSTTNDQFATDVDISGHFIVAGAPNSNASAGAVYVFTTTLTGGWSQQTKLTASDATKLDNFGTEVAISGDHILVGAGRVGTTGATGKAYTFSRSTIATVSNGTTTPVTTYAWNQDQLITGTGGNFGGYVDISGNNIVIGAINYTIGGIASIGQAYIYQASQLPNFVGGAYINIVETNSLTTTINSYNLEQVALLRWYSATTTNSISIGGTTPQAICFDGSNIWVANQVGNNITKIVASTGATTNFNVGVPTLGICYDGLNIWVTNYSAPAITKILAQTGTVLKTYGLPTSQAICFDGSNIWTANGTTSNITKLVVSSGATTNYSVTGLSINSICFDGTNIWVTNDSSSAIKISTNGSILGTFSVGTSPSGICYDGQNIWVSNNGSANVTKLLASTGSNLGTFSVGTSPSGICFDGQYIWVANTGSANVTKLLASTGELIGTYTVGTNPQGICFDGANIWVSNTGSGTVSKL